MISQFLGWTIILTWCFFELSFQFSLRFLFSFFFSKSVVRLDWIILVKFKLLVLTQNQLSLLKVSSKFWRHFFHCPGDPSAIHFLLQIENEVFLSWDLVMARNNCENFLNDNGWSSRPICDKPKRHSRYQVRDHGFPLGGFQIPSHRIPAPPQWIRDHLSMDSCIPLGDIDSPSVDCGLPLRNFCTPFRLSELQIPLSGLRIPSQWNTCLLYTSPSPRDA